MIWKTKDVDSVVHILLYTFMYAVHIAAVMVFAWVCLRYAKVGVWFFYPVMMGVSLFSGSLFYCKYDVLRDVERDGSASERERLIKRWSGRIAAIMFGFTLFFVLLCIGERKT